MIQIGHITLYKPISQINPCFWWLLLWLCSFEQNKPCYHYSFSAGLKLCWSLRYDWRNWCSSCLNPLLESKCFWLKCTYSHRYPKHWEVLTFRLQFSRQSFLPYQSSFWKFQVCPYFQSFWVTSLSHSFSWSWWMISELQMGYWPALSRIVFFLCQCLVWCLCKTSSWLRSDFETPIFRCFWLLWRTGLRLWRST